MQIIKKKLHHTIRKITLTKTGYFIGVFLIIIVLYGANKWFIYTVNKVAFDRKIAIYDVKTNKAKLSLKGTKSNTRMFDLESIHASESINPFDDDAKHWGGLLTSQPGVTVFDANEDGKLDVYFCQDGQNWARPTDDNGLISDKPFYQHNALYLNQGNDERGHPVFIQVSELCRNNDTYVEEELLVENYLFPRETVRDSEKRGGRQSIVAAAADFNNDGRPDLIVGNGLPGMIMVSPQDPTDYCPVLFPQPAGQRGTPINPYLPRASTLVRLYTPRHDVNDP